LQAIPSCPSFARLRRTRHGRRSFLGAENAEKRIFDDVIRSEGIRIVKTPVRAPQANAIAERFVRTIRSECLGWLLILNQWGHRTAMSADYGRFGFAPDRTTLGASVIGRAATRLKSAWRHPLVAVPASLLGLYMAYTGATARHLLWKTAPHAIRRLGTANGGRWALLGVGVLIVILAAGPAALTTVRRLNRRRGTRTPSANAKLQLSARDSPLDVTVEGTAELWDTAPGSRKHGDRDLQVVYGAVRKVGVGGDAIDAEITVKAYDLKMGQPI
jgi:hypothetical protein